MFKGLKGLLAGLLAGVGLGVLFSPKKGEKIRKDLKNEVDEGGLGLGTIKDTIVGMGKDIGDTCKECFDDIVESDEYQEGKEKVKNYAEKAKKRAKKTVKDVKKKLK